MATLEGLDAATLQAVMVAYRDLLVAHQRRLDELNVFPVPDADTGTNLARTLDAVVDALPSTPGDLAGTGAAIRHGSLMGARGNSGVITSQLLRGLTDAFEAAGEAGPAAWAAGLRAGAEAAERAVLHPAEGTVLTVARTAAAAAEEAAGAGWPLVEVLEAARAAATDALARTPDQLPVLGAAGVVDAGGAGFVLLLDAALHVVDGRPVPVPEDADGPGVTRPTLDGGPQWELMCLLEVDEVRVDDLRRAWGSVGDSVVVVGGEGVWTGHVHTDDVDAALALAQELGATTTQVRVSDLRAPVPPAGGTDDGGRPTGGRRGHVRGGAGRWRAVGPDGVVTEADDLASAASGLVAHLLAGSPHRLEVHVGPAGSEPVTSALAARARHLVPGLVVEVDHDGVDPYEFVVT